MTRVFGFSRPLFLRCLTACGRVNVAVLQGFLVTACSSVPPAKIAVPQVPDAYILTLGTPFERDFAAHAKDEYELRLEAGLYLELTVDQTDLDVTATLAGPDGSTLVSVNDPGRRERAERIVAIASATGIYRLTITPSGPQSPDGRYWVVLKQLRPAVPGDEDRVVAERLFAEGRLSEFQDTQGQRRAVSLYKAALARWQAAKDEPGQVRAMVELETADFDLSQSSEAIVWSERALTLARKINDEEGQARALFFLGEVQLSEDPRAALEAYGQSLDLWTRLGNATGQGKSLLGKAIVQLNLHRQDEALGSLQKALPLLHQAGELGKEATALTALQGIFMTRGETGEALRYLTQALALSRQAGDSYAEANALYNLANIQKLRGELQQALESLENALIINRRLGDRRGEFSSLYGLGSIYHDLGELDKAREKYEQALTLAETLEVMAAWRARLLNNIGWILYRQGNGDVALDYFDRALALSLERKDPDGIAAALHNLGVAEVSLGDPGDGLKALRQALELRQGLNAYPWAQTLRELGTVYHRLGKPEEASCSFEESLAIGRRIGAPGLMAETLFRWALLDREQGRLADALAKVKEAIDLTESVRNRVEADALRTSFFSSKRDYYELYIDLLIRMGYQGKALEASERARARSLLDLLVEGRLDLTRGISPELKQQEKDVAAQISEIQGALIDELSTKEPQEEKIGNLRARLDEIMDERQSLEVRIHSEHPRYSEVRYPSPLGREEVQKRLPEDTALLEYSLGREGSYAFVVTRERLEVYRLPDSTWIAAKVRAVREGVESPSRRFFSSYVRAAHELYQTLITPARPVLAGKRHLLISPDGPLHFLAFEVLLKKDGQGRKTADLPYLLREFSVSYIPSASVLFWLEGPQQVATEAGAPPMQLIAFADPLYDAKYDERTVSSSLRDAVPEFEAPLQELGLGPVRRLKGTAREVAAIASLYPSTQVRLYTGGQASEENVKGNPLVERARRIHFATHGVFNERQPELSGLRLTRTAKEDGILQVHEIFNLNLNAELVVLSACNTGRGKEVSGEGLVGLTRAFLYAGTQSLVVSLWPVADAQTPELMLNFYQKLDQIRDKAEALRQAKLNMIRKGSRAARPFYWAAFILVGRPH